MADEATYTISPTYAEMVAAKTFPISEAEISKRKIISGAFIAVWDSPEFICTITEAESLDWAMLTPAIPCHTLRNAIIGLLNNSGDDIEPRVRIGWEIDANGNINTSAGCIYEDLTIAENSGSTGMADLMSFFKSSGLRSVVDGACRHVVGLESLGALERFPPYIQVMAILPEITEDKTITTRICAQYV